ncbi:hypothetical protein [Algibacter sp. L4_22]|uniref:hypothetical protein n=1 Tax=Algibacter sp. L4_22 TaxID=2942477 RepID=UPI00201B93B8|nr:hypothetical protein [Algibacter sp. L4_22]MCL5127302.1 hypothetical protein [Algibacter sp. L4_22]
MTKTNFGEFREENLYGTNGVINEFMRAFDLDLLMYMSNGDTPLGFEVRDYYDINEGGKNYLLSLNSELKAFRDDYYNLKSAYEIAERIDLTVNIVYPYVKKRTYSDSGLNMRPVRTSVPFKDFNKASKVSYLSSFQILKDIQRDYQLEKLRARIK